jgi:hypothetical protein
VLRTGRDVLIERQHLRVTHVVRELDRCIFCGGAEMTEEHLMADWAHRAFARTRKPTNQLRAMWQAPSQLAISADDPVPTAKVICRPCNNEWISSVDGDASRVLKPLVRGDREVALDSNGQAAAAAWIYKTALIFDASEHGVDGPLATLRPQFRQTRRAGPGCVIYTGPAIRQPLVEIPGLANPVRFWMLGVRAIAGTMNLTINVTSPDGTMTHGEPTQIPIPGYQVMIGALCAYLGGPISPIAPDSLDRFEQVWPAQDRWVMVRAAELGDTS